MTVLKAHFDGKVLIPDESVNLPLNCTLEVHVKSVAAENRRPLAEVAELLKQFPENPDWPADGAAQHDHYLYGTPQRPWSLSAVAI
jgi:hypothetical protein